jgi:hypothetical protein
MSNGRFPLAEVFGLPTVDHFDSQEDIQAVRERLRDKKCPFKQKRCHKIDDSGNAACTTFWGDETIMTCPTRFEEGGKMFRHASDFIFGRNKEEPDVKILDEKRIYVTEGRYNDGDFIIFDADSEEFGLVEIHSVYNSNNTTEPYEEYADFIKNEHDIFEFDQDRSPPSPDISSAIKRLVFQMISKGSVFKELDRRQVYVTQKSFYDHFGFDVENLGKPPYYRSKSDPLSPSESKPPHRLDDYRTYENKEGEEKSEIEKPEVAWLIYELHLNDGSYELTLSQEIYTTHDKLIDGISSTFENQKDVKGFYDKVWERYEARNSEESYYNNMGWV